MIEQIEIKLMEGVTDLNYQQSDIELNSINGFKQMVTCKIGGINIEFINTGYSTRLNMWQVMTSYQSNDEIGRIAAQKVIESNSIFKEKLFKK